MKVFTHFETLRSQPLLPNSYFEPKPPISLLIIPFPTTYSISSWQRNIKRLLAFSSTTFHLLIISITAKPLPSNSATHRAKATSRHLVDVIQTNPLIDDGPFLALIQDLSGSSTFSSLATSLICILDDIQSFPMPEAASNDTQQAPNVSKGQKKSTSMAWVAVSAERTMRRAGLSSILGKTERSMGQD